MGKKVGRTCQRQAKHYRQHRLHLTVLEENPRALRRMGYARSLKLNLKIGETQATSHSPEDFMPNLSRAHGSRFAIALACWLPAGICIGISLMLAFSGTAPASNTAWRPESSLSIAFVSLGPAFSWCALAFMTAGWVMQRRVHWFWPLAGSITGIPSAIIFSSVFLLYLPAAILAFYLVYYHLSAYKKDVLLTV